MISNLSKLIHAKNTQLKSTKFKIITLQKTNITKQYTLAVLNGLKQVMYSTCDKVSKTLIISSEIVNNIEPHFKVVVCLLTPNNLLNVQTTLTFLMKDLRLLNIQSDSKLIRSLKVSEYPFLL